jgi:hypothetical protein
MTHPFSFPTAHLRHAATRRAASCAALDWECRHFVGSGRTSPDIPHSPPPPHGQHERHSEMAWFHPLRLTPAPKVLRSIAKGCRALARLPWYPQIKSGKQTHRLLHTLRPPAATSISPAAIRTLRSSLAAAKTSKRNLKPNGPTPTTPTAHHAASAQLPE